MMRRLLWGLAAFAVLVAAGLAVFAPGGRTTVVRSCPSCFGFTQSGERAYIENASAATAWTANILPVARSRVALWYGPPQSTPLLFVCVTMACPRKFNPGFGSAIGFTVRTDTIVLTPKGTDPAIMAHEWSHAELKKQIGLWNFAQAQVPAWFDEGLAVVVAQDVRYLGTDVRKKYCTPDLSAADLPARPDRWGPAAGHDRMIYASAACVVNRWLDAHDSAAGLHKLIADIRGGESFNQAFGGA